MKFASSEEFHSRRSPVASRRGIVASSQTPATLAGLDILNRGGSAADAAVAIAAALQVTQPCSTGLGGDCFALYFESSTRTLHALNGSGRSPKALTLEKAVKGSGGGVLPDYHPYTVTVPGAPAAWCDLVGRFGRLPLSTILAPSIELAEGGFPVAPLTSEWWRTGAAEQLSKTPNGRELMADNGGPFPGTIVRLPTLSRSLATLAEEGSKAFYVGTIAERIVEAVQEVGGVLSLDDLEAHASEWVTPISVEYRGAQVHECPPNGQGIAVLIALNILKQLDVESQPAGSAGRYHLLIEAMRLAFADALAYVADPARAEVPLEDLLSEGYAQKRSRTVDPRRAVAAPAAGNPWDIGGPVGDDTVYFCVVDSEGNGCSFINSNFMGFGTGIVPQGCGFALQNRGRGFVLDRRHPNCLAPGKRPYHTIIPGLMTDGRTGNLLSLFGVMGGMMQPQGHLQVVSALLDDELDPQAALDRPRFELEGGRPDGIVLLEDALAADTVAAIEEIGHQVRVIAGSRRAVFGLGQVIVRGKEDVWWGGCDPRSDGCALAQY